VTAPKLRPVLARDVTAFLRHASDPGARWLAAFASAPDPTRFRQRWSELRADPSRAARTIIVDGRVAGYVVRFPLFGRPSVAYWLGREFWGRGIATRALSEFLVEFPERPIFARVASDNFGSRRVLEKCGFRVVAQERSFAEARGVETAELVLRLGTRPARAPPRRRRPTKRVPR
jgi:RimJ/RimL family protein N-acetyltransferase